MASQPRTVTTIATAGPHVVDAHDGNSREQRKDAGEEDEAVALRDLADHRRKEIAIEQHGNADRDQHGPMKPAMSLEFASPSLRRHDPDQVLRVAARCQRHLSQLPPAPLELRQCAPFEATLQGALTAKQLVRAQLCATVGHAPRTRKYA